MSSSDLNKITVLGGTGGLGTHIVQELVDQGFQVTIFSRSANQDKAPKGATVKVVNYDDVESLKSALAGQDAVVSVLGGAAIGGDQQAKVADAALAAGVKRFIPSEFGINTRKVGKDEAIAKILGGKTKLVDDLIAKAAQNPNFTWTGVSTGLFFDFLGLDAKAKTFSIVDSGNERFQTSTKPFIGKAVASILKHPKETANQYLSIASATPTQNEILKIAEEATGSKWTVTRDDSAQLQKTGEEGLAKGDFSSFLPLLRVVLYRDGKGQAPTDGEKANKLLGLPEQEDLKEAFQKFYLS